MDAREEHIRRIALRERAQRGLSDAGFAELLIAVRANPAQFAQGPEDEAMGMLVDALERFGASRDKDDLRDDDEFALERSRRLELMRVACAHALDVDPTCTDAALCSAIAADPDPDDLLELLLPLEGDAQAALDARGETEALADDAATGLRRDLWADVFAHPLLRVKDAIARTYLDSARFKLAQEKSLELLDLAPSDVLGARHTGMLSYARLEDEQGLDELDARMGRRGDAWQSLARIIVLFKTNRRGAALRALRGFDGLCEGGVYALLRPVFVDSYLPDRPTVAPYSFEEATLAVHEADPVIVDVPDLPLWVEGQKDMRASALRFAERSGLDF